MPSFVLFILFFYIINGCKCVYKVEEDEDLQYTYLTKKNEKKNY